MTADEEKGECARLIGYRAQLILEKKRMLY